MKRLAAGAAATSLLGAVVTVAVVPVPAAATKWMGIATAFVATSLLFHAVIRLLTREEPALHAALRLYDTAPGEDPAREGATVAESRIVRNAVDVVERLARRRGVLARVEELLARADLPFRPGEALFFSMAGVGLVAAGASVVAPSPLVALVLAVLAATAPVTAVNVMARRRRRKFVNQLPGTLQLLAGSLRAGYSLMQGVEAVSQEVEDPMGRELRRVGVESRLGRPLEEALDDAADRLGSSDFRWAVMAIRIQREVGGNLSELLQGVAATMIERKRLKREVDALTAEAKISAIILGLLPVGLGAALFVLNRPYIGLLFTDLVGRAMLAGAAVLALLGFVWMSRIIKIGI